jgi:putative endonuclease
MQERHSYATYIMASRSRNLYIGVTGNLKKRILEHKCHIDSGFTDKYNCTRLVWFENFQYIDNAIATEKKLKGWLRARKIALIEQTNSAWEDLSTDWFTSEQLEKFGTEKQILRYTQDDKSSN